MYKILFPVLRVVWFQQMEKELLLLLAASHFHLTSYAFKFMAWPDCWYIFTLYIVWTFLNETWPTYFHLCVPA